MISFQPLFKLNLIIGISLSILLSVAVVSATTTGLARDPFRSSQPLHQSDPLQAYPVTQYRVHGVAVLVSKAAAVIYTPEQTWHLVRVGDYLGREQAVIRAITIKGVQIELGQTHHWLPVLQ